jgi:hypothetical protein
LGAGGPEFKSRRPDQSLSKTYGHLLKALPRVANLIKPYKAGRLVNQIKKLAEDVGQLPRLKRSPDPGDNYVH